MKIDVFYYIKVMAKLRLFELLHAALWAFRKIIYIFVLFFYYCKI